MSNIGFLSPEQYGFVLLFGFLYVFAFSYMFWDYKNQNAIKWFIIGSSLAGLWLTLEGILVLVHDPEISFMLLYLMRYVGAATSVSIFIFVMEYTRGYNFNYKHIILVYLPLVVLHLYVLLTPESLFATVEMYETHVVWDYGPLGMIHFLYITILHIVALGNLSLESMTSRGIRRRQSLVILIALLVSIIPGMITGLDFFPAYFNLSLFTISITLFLMTIGLKKYNIFRVNVVKNSNLSSEIEEGIITFNDQDLVVECNETAEKVTGGVRVGDKISDLYDEVPEIESLVNGSEDSILLYDNNRKYNVKLYDVSQDKKVIMFRDNTELYDKKEKLSLIRKIHARIFRHNLGNELTVVKGNANRIRSGIEEDTHLKEPLETLESATDRLLSLNDKTSKINKVIKTIEETQEFEIQNLVSEKAQKLRSQFPDAEFEINTDIQSGTVEAHEMLPTAIENTIENAIEHNDNPTIDVQSEIIEDGRTRLTVTDDGQGINQSEYDPVMRDDISQLQHASSGGLWLIKWVTEYASPCGEFEIERQENGTKVEIKLKTIDSDCNS